MDPLHQFQEQPTASGEVASVAARPAAGGEKLVHQIAVAGLEIDHIEARGGSAASSGDVAADEPFDVSVGEHAIGVGGDAVAGVVPVRTGGLALVVMLSLR